MEQRLVCKSNFERDECSFEQDRYGAYSVYMVDVDPKLHQFEPFFMDESTADVTFVCGPDDETAINVPAHKIILAACSPVFKTMFYGSLPEKNDIRLTDTTADAFKEFLQFFYLHRLELSIENAPEVINLVKKYELNDLLDICSTFICHKLTRDPRIDQLCDSLELAMRFDLPKLKSFCDLEFAGNYVKFLESEAFLECNSQNLKMILQMEEFKSHGNVLFRQCLKWARNAWKERESSINGDDVEPTLSDLRQQLENFMDLIEYSSMDIQEITDILEEFSDFFIDEQLDVINKILIAKYSVPQFQEKELTCALFRPKNARFDGFVPRDCTSAIEVTEFQTTTTIHLVGYDYVRIFKNWVTDPLPIWLTIVRKSSDINNGKDVTLFREKLTCTQYSKFDYVKSRRFDNPCEQIAIEPNAKYEIRIKIPNFAEYNYYTTDIENISNEFTFGDNGAEKITIDKHGHIAALHFKILGPSDDIW